MGGVKTGSQLNLIEDKVLHYSIFIGDHVLHFEYEFMKVFDHSNVTLTQILDFIII